MQTYISRSALALSAFLLLAVGSPVYAQRSRLKGPISSANRVRLPGHVRGQASGSNDDGVADASLVLPDITLVLRPSDTQQADLDQLLADQQNSASPHYREWLSPDQYAARFGASAEDVQRITDWLRQQNLEVTGVARGRNSISARGTARAVEKAFDTQIRRYRVNGRRHFANATNPSLPADLDVMVSSIEGLDDFRFEPRSVVLPQAAADPSYTSSSGRHYLAPDDLATIYNITPLLKAGLDGAGQTIVVAGQTELDLTDVRTFRARFGLPALDPQMILVPNTTSPGTISDDVGEANLDLQWAGAVARNARIMYVYSRNVMDAVHYAIDQNLAPVISVSYGLCELAASPSSLRAFQAWARQANAQGITWVNASGDSGGADCAQTNSAVGLAVDSPASVPEVTAIGGTTLTESSGQYWNSSNGAHDASALSYIPEAVWNDSTSGSPASGGGGASTFFAKPSWQTGAGVPNDGVRSVPDISLAASANLNGYLVYNSGRQAVYGGTSAGTPVFAGVLALLNQQMARSSSGSAGVGNINPRLYSLAQSTPSAFHDISRGDNIVTVTCTSRVRACSGGSFGYSANAGYDLASGLGSIDAFQLVNNWTGPATSISRAAPKLAVSATSTQIASGQTLTITVAFSGVDNGAPSGSITFKAGSTSIGTASVTTSTAGWLASLTVNSAALQLGTNTITAEFSGDSVYSTASASINITVVASSTTTITGLGNAASFRTGFAPGMLFTILGSSLAPTTWSASVVPLPTQAAGVTVTVNGIPAPLLYVSSTQINAQMPYEVPVGAEAALAVNNNGSVATFTVPVVGAAAPGIFTDANFAPVPSTSLARGAVGTLFITGAGSLTPPIASGAAPSSDSPVAALPRSTQNVSVTVGGISAPIFFAGIPAGLIGVMQVNYQVPQNLPPGPAPVVVFVGNTNSQPATLTVVP